MTLMFVFVGEYEHLLCLLEPFCGGSMMLVVFLVRAVWDVPILSTIAQWIDLSG